MSHARRLRRSAWIAGPNWTGSPSREARQLASAPQFALPPGLWHTSADMALMLAQTRPVITDAEHVPSGAKFRLLSQPDGPILGISAEDDPARKLIAAAWEDPTAWANAQQWWINHPPGATS